MSKFYDALNEFSYASSQRGEKYFKDGRIFDFDFSNYFCTAKIHGSKDSVYRVKIKFNKRYEMVNNSCTCPVGYYCKHVAALLYKLDDMAINDELIVEEKEEIKEDNNGFNYKSDLEAIFLKYFINRYHYSPSFSHINAYIKKHQDDIAKDYLAFFTYLSSKLFEYCFSYYYDIKETIEFLSFYYVTFFKEEDYYQLLNYLKSNNKRHFLMILSSLFSSKAENDEYEIDKLNNNFLSSLLEDRNEFESLANGTDDLFNPALIYLSNLESIAKISPNIINQYSLREDYYSLIKNGVKDLLGAKRLYLYSIILLKGKYSSIVDTKAIKEIEKFDYSMAKELVFQLFYYSRSSENFVQFMKHYQNTTLDNDKLIKLKRIKNKPFYLSMYLKEEFFLDGSNLRDIMALSIIPDFFFYYKEQIIEIALKTINRTKKLKNYDHDLHAGIYILDYFAYQDMTSILLDKNVVDKLNEKDFYYTYLYKYHLLEALGFKQYGIISK